MRVLIVKLSALGDIVHCFPVLEHLQSRYDDIQIDWVVDTRNASLLSAHPLIHRIIPLDLSVIRRAWWKPASWQQLCKQLSGIHYDILFDLQGNIKSGLVTKLVSAREKVGFAWSAVAEWPNMLATTHRYAPPAGQNIREDYLSIVRQHVGDAPNSSSMLLELSASQQQVVDEIAAGPFIVVCPGSRWTNKQLPADTLGDFLLRLQEHTSASLLVVWGNKQEQMIAQQLSEGIPHTSVAPKLSLPALQHVMDQAELVVAMDSLPLHLAGTTSTPTFSVFGASSANKYRPLGVGHASVQGACPYGQQFNKRCPKLRTCSTGACVKELSVDVLWKACIQSGFIGPR